MVRTVTVDGTAHEHAGQIIADLRRTHAQLKVDAADPWPNKASAWSMRLTLEEVDVLLAIVDERDDLKRRLLGDWEPDLDDEPGIRIVCNEPEPSAVKLRRPRRCNLDAGHDGDHRFPKTIEDRIAGTDKRIRALGGVDGRIEPDLKRASIPMTAEQLAPFCPRRDTVHDCPLGGCADASPRESEIPDMPQCPWYREAAPNMRKRCKLAHGHDGDHERFGETWTQAEAVTAFGHTLAGEPRETPPRRCPGMSSHLSYGGSRWCEKEAGHEGSCSRDGWSWAAPSGPPA